MTAKHTYALSDWKGFFRAPHLYQQFGQTDDESTFNGATGCTHTCWQKIVQALTGTRYSHDELSKIAGYPWPRSNPTRRGLQTAAGPNDVVAGEAGHIVNHFHLPYRAHFFSGIDDAAWSQINHWSLRGPVMLSVKYDWYPQRRGYVYFGQKADGKPNGFAETNGATQLSGFTGAHAVIRVGYTNADIDRHRWHSFVFEPNHNSASRPEHPPFDRMRNPQLRRAVNALPAHMGQAAMVVYPTHDIAPKGA